MLFIQTQANLHARTSYKTNKNPRIGVSHFATYYARLFYALCTVLRITELILVHLVAARMQHSPALVESRRSLETKSSRSRHYTLKSIKKLLFTMLLLSFNE